MHSRCQMNMAIFSFVNARTFSLVKATKPKESHSNAWLSFLRALLLRKLTKIVSSTSYSSYIASLEKGETLIF